MLGTSATVNYNYGIDFNSGFADTFPVYRPMDIRFTDAGICDTLGNLLFYTNGIYIANRNHDSLQNTTGFNPGFYTTYDQLYGLQMQQACLILPAPGSDSLYYIFHESGEQLAIYDAPTNLRYSQVDISLDNGLGGIIPSKKNIIVIDDTLIWGRVTACKHANGRDYWVMAHNYYSNIFYRILVTPDTLILSSQAIGMPHTLLPNYYGQAVFSPDGSKYAIQINDITVQLYDFDRCSGDLSNPISILKVDTVNGNAFALIGLAFSGSGQYLYLSNDIFIHQYDTWSGNVIASDLVVAQWDTFYAPCCNAETKFFMMQLGPDNRIYISQGIGNNILHYIKYPDVGGVGCNVVQDSLITPGYNTFTFPNIVNYDLMNDINSPCDTVLSSGDLINDHLGIALYPNPAANYFWINYSLPDNRHAILEIYDGVGKLIAQSTLYGFQSNLLVHTDNFKAGMYLIRVNGLDGNQIAVKKLLIIKQF